MSLRQPSPSHPRLRADGPLPLPQAGEGFENPGGATPSPAIGRGLG
jgi:hypothetical protein